MIRYMVPNLGTLIYLTESNLLTSIGTVFFSDTRNYVFRVPFIENIYTNGSNNTKIK